MESSASSSPASIPVDQFLKQLGDSTLFSAEEVQSLLAGLQPAQRGDARTLVDVLVKQDKLTRYQGQMLLQGKSKGLVLGNYAILDKLGQGGMGMVFKARHKRMKRLVALKVLSPAITKNPTAVQRFQREVEAAAKLSHPNIVAAYDADEAKGVHFLVMEYVEGSDLAKLVKTSGPLQPAQAAQCILQAAHGLLHAHQSGIIHRDIKPHNLLLEIGNRKSASGNVKILDMGLARIEGGNTPGSGAGGLTESGSIMGTCDYMAPEQAMNTKNADARADIYSLGCTLYYLLSGKAMYGGETAMEKLMAHQSEPIPPLRTVCPEVPKKLEAVYQKMVAKKVADRYQSMAEVIADLEACNLPAAPLSGLSATLPALSPKQAEAGGETQSSVEDMTQAADQSPLAKPGKSRKRWLIAGGVFALLLGMAIIAVSTDKGSFIIETDDPEVSVALDKAGGVILHDKKANRQFRLNAGSHRLKSGDYEIVVTELPDGLEFSTKSFTIKRDGEVRVKVSLVSGGRQPPVGKGVDAAWIKQVQAMPPDKQVEAVAAKLKELNPGFDGKVTHKIDNGVVTELTFLTDDVTDILPVRALTGLKSLDCNGSVLGKGKLLDLSPLEGMGLTKLVCTRNPLTDLTPLHQIPLTHLNFHYTPVSDLLPLKDVPLTYLNCMSTKVTDLSPLRNKLLQGLICSNNRNLTDLSPLKDMKLTELGCSLTSVTDLSPLKGMPLKTLSCDVKPERDADILRSIKTLETINSKPAAEFWKEVDTKQSALDAWIKQVQAMPADKQVEAVAAKLKELNPGFDGKVEHRIVGGVVLEFGFFSDVVTDIRPVRALAGLKRLDVTGSVAHKSNFSDLSPLQGMSLIHVLCARTKVKDLSPLKGMPLKALYCGTTLVEDLSPLKDMGLEILHFSGSRVRDISPLEGMSLKDLWYDFKPADAPLVRSIKTLKTINNKPAAEFWKDVDAKQSALDAWMKQVQAMPAEKQVEAVAAKLKELNPGFDGRVEPTIKDGVVIVLTVVADNVTDLSPLRGLAGLQTLRCSGSPPGKGRLADLSPLRGMKLTTLICTYTQVADLTPLQGMPLTRLECGGTPVADLAPLKGMPLAILAFGGNQVADLAPLKGMPLTLLDCAGTKVTDLAPLKGMPLTSLFCGRTKVTDLSPLKGVPLKELRCDFKAERDVEILRSIKTLEKINEKPAAEFWKEVDARQSALNAWVKQVQAMPAEKQVEAVAAKLQELNPGFDGKVTHKVVRGVVIELRFLTDSVTDLSPVRALIGLRILSCSGSAPGKGTLADLSPLKGMPLLHLECGSTLVADLSPLKGMRLTELEIHHTRVVDLSPLRGMPLTYLACSATPVADLSPLAGMPLTRLICYVSPVADLTPLKGMPLTELWTSNTKVSDLSPLKGMKLTSLWCSATKVTDLSPLSGMPLKDLRCDFQPERDAAILRSLKTLERINGKHAAEFWKDNP